METNFSQIAGVFTRLKQEKPEKPQDRELYKLIQETQEELARCRQNLMFADSQALTDMYIYSIKAHELRYAHLLRLAKADAV